MSFVASDVYQSPRIDEPLMMEEPDFMVGLNSKTKTEIKRELVSLDQRQRLEMVTYAYMNVVHLRAGETNEYAGLKEYIYNEMTLFRPDLIIDDVMDSTVAKYKQAPERSGKTAQHLLDAILNVHMGRCGFVIIGSPKDNVAEVTEDLNKALALFKKHIEDTYHEPMIDAFKEIFGKNMWGVDKFIHLDGASKLVEHKNLIPKKGGENYHLISRILNGGSIPVFSATSLQPVNTIYETLRKINHVDYFILLDEADSVIKPSASGTTKMASKIEQIIGMRSFAENVCDICGNVHVCVHGDQLGHPGTHGGAKKIMFLSATMNLPVEYFNSLPGERVEVRRPYGQRAQTLLGGVNDHTFVQIDMNDISGSLKTMLKTFFDSKNPLMPTYNFEYHLDNDYVIDAMENVMTRPIEYFASKKPLMKLNSYLYPERKTNTVALVQGSPFVEGIGNKKNVSDDDDTANQMRMIEAYFGESSIHEFVPKNAIAVSYFSGGARIWFRDQRYGPKGVSVSTIIVNEELEDKVVTEELTETEEQAAREIIEEFKNGAENISNAVEFISWFYGVHVPIVVFGFNKALRAIDCRDREHIVTHQFIVVSDSHGADNEKQIAGRSKASKGEMMRLNFDVSNDDDNFKVTIAANVSLEDAATLENLPYQNAIDPDNGKRKVDANIKEAVTRKQVLSKAAKRYEPKANVMVANDDEERLYDFNNDDDDTYTLIISDGSEFVFTADNVEAFDVSMMPGRTQILKCLQKAWMLEYFGIIVSSRTINRIMTAGKNTSITTLINKGHLVLIRKDRNVRIVKVSSDIQQFPTST